MGRFNDEHLAKLNPTGVAWKDMTEEQRFELQKSWDAIVSDPKELYCTCPRSFCRNNHNCIQCMALHRYYDCFSDCLEPIELGIQEGIPEEKRFPSAYKMQMDGNEDSGLVDPSDPDGSRARLVAAAQKQKFGLYEAMDRWTKIVRNPKNRACTCKNTDCWYHGNCVKCVALHRHFGGVPACSRYIIDQIEEWTDAYWAAQKAEKNGSEA